MTKTVSASVFQVFYIFLLLGLTSFGGPVAHIGYFHQEFVTRRKWLSDEQFSQLLAICQFIPGPASSQLGFAIGLSRAGGLGALAAFIGFTLPSVLALVMFVSLLPLLSEGLGQALVHGLKIVAFVVVTDAVIGMANKLCTDNARKTIALSTAGLLLLISSSFAQIAIIIAAGLIGLKLFKTEAKTEHAGWSIDLPKWLSTLCLFSFLGLLTLTFWPSELISHSIFASFYQAGSLVFGGGHVVLPYLEQSFVATGLLDKETFLAGYGAVQAVPGPLFTFASYLSAVVATELPSWLIILIGTLAVFLPGFLLLLAVLPKWQTISANNNAKAAISGVNAAVVGLLAAALYDPIFTSSILSATDLVIAIVGFGILVVWKKPPIWVVIWGIVASLAMYWF